MFMIDPGGGVTYQHFLYSFISPYFFCLLFLISLSLCHAGSPSLKLSDTGLKEDWSARRHLVHAVETRRCTVLWQ